MTPDNESTTVFSARLIAAMWDEEAIDNECVPSSSNVTALVKLRRCRMAISRLARQRHLYGPPAPSALHSYTISDFC